MAWDSLKETEESGRVEAKAREEREGEEEARPSDRKGVVWSLENIDKDPGSG